VFITFTVIGVLPQNGDLVGIELVKLLDLYGRIEHGIRTWKDVRGIFFSLRE